MCPYLPCKRSQVQYAFKRKSHLQRHLTTCGHRQTQIDLRGIGTAHDPANRVASDTVPSQPEDQGEHRHHKELHEDPQSDSPLTRALKEKYQADKDSLEKKEQSFLRRKDSQQKLLEYLQSLTERSDLPNHPSLSPGEVVLQTSDPLVRSMWEKYRTEKEVLESEESELQGERDSLTKLVTYLSSLHPGA